MITHFIEHLAKDSTKMPKSENFKRVHTMLTTRERSVTRVSLEFLNDIVPVFKEFILLFQKEWPVVHLLYDSMCSVPLKLTRRFMTEQAIRNKYGYDLTLIECTDVKLQLPEKAIVIETDVRKALKNLTHDQQKYAMLGTQSFFGTMVTELQSKLPLKNELLRQLGCLNPLKKNDGFTVSAVEKLSSSYTPNLIPVK